MTLGKKWLIGLVIAVVFGLLMVRYLDRVPRRHYCDFRVYHHAARGVLAGKDIYFRDSMEITPFKYSPFFAFIFVPIGVLPIKVAAALFFTLNVLLTVVMFRMTVKILGVKEQLGPMGWKGRNKALFYILSVLFVSRFILLVWDSGQVNILMCALVLASLYLVSLRRELPAGAFLAAAILIKYTPAIFLPYFLVRRQFKVVIWTVVFLGIWLALPALAVGLQKEMAYLASWMPSIVETSLDHWSYIDTKNQSLISMVIRFFSDAGYNINITHLTFRQGQLVGYAAAAVLYLLVLLPSFGKPRDQRIDYALLFCFIPLFNPNAWLINFVAMAVPFVFLLSRLMEKRGKDIFLWVCLVLAFFSMTMMAEDIVGNDWENRGELFSNVTLGSLLLVVALLKLKFGRASGTAGLATAGSPAGRWQS